MKLKKTKQIKSIEGLLDDLSPHTIRFLRYAVRHPGEPLQAFSEADNPEEAEDECRELVSELRKIAVNGVRSMPVFSVCRVERDGIWCEFTLNPDFVDLLCAFDKETTAELEVVKPNECTGDDDIWLCGKCGDEVGEVYNSELKAQLGTVFNEHLCKWLSAYGNKMGG